MEVAFSSYFLTFQLFPSDLAFANSILDFSLFSLLTIFVCFFAKVEYEVIIPGLRQAPAKLSLAHQLSAAPCVAVPCCAVLCDAVP